MLTAWRPQKQGASAAGMLSSRKYLEIEMEQSQFCGCGMVQVPFDCLGAAYSAFEQHRVYREEETFLETGEVTIQISVAASAAPALQAALADSTSGRAVLQPLTP